MSPLALPGRPGPDGRLPAARSVLPYPFINQNIEIVRCGRDSREAGERHIFYDARNLVADYSYDHPGRRMSKQVDDGNGAVRDASAGDDGRPRSQLRPVSCSGGPALARCRRRCPARAAGSVLRGWTGPGRVGLVSGP